MYAYGGGGQILLRSGNGSRGGVVGVTGEESIKGYSIAKAMHIFFVFFSAWRLPGSLTKLSFSHFTTTETKLELGGEKTGWKRGRYWHGMAWHETL